MRKIQCVSIMVGLLFCGTAFAETIRVSSASLRQKPGSFYPVVATLERGDEVVLLDAQGMWHRVSTEKKGQGWLSKNALTAQGPTIDYGKMAMDVSGRRMTTVMITAAVKGFFENRVDTGSINRALFEAPFVRYITPSDYDAFKRETFAGRSAHGAYLLKIPLSPVGPFVLDEEMIAASAYITGRLAAPGLVSDTNLVAYVNHVAQLIVESSEFYDLPISVHVVETPDVFANATPMGVILISRGMLRIIRGENELACLLAHELSHVTLHHGMTETEVRRSKIHAEEAFQEMDEALGKDEGEQELDDMALDMYEYAIRGRKEAYELAADARGILYAQRAGYDPSGMASLLLRLQRGESAPSWDEPPSHWRSPFLSRRIDALPKRAPSTAYVNFGRRYTQKVR